jgi:hypothetical protein
MRRRTTTSERGRRMNKFGVVLGSFLLATCMITGSTPLLAQSDASNGRPALAKRLTVDDVIKLSKAGFSDDVIIEKLKKNGQAFDLSTDQMLQLKSAGVSDKVVQVMLDPAKADAPTAPVAPAGAAAKAGSDPSLPDEMGIYYRKQPDTKWGDLTPEVVNWKTGGIMKSFASGGLVKGDVNGHLNGKNSNTVVATGTQFMVVAAEGVAITEYQLLKLHENSDNREFRSRTGGVFHASGGGARDELQFESTKVSPRHYLIVLPASLKIGEYGFLPPGAVASTNAAGSTGKIYTFHLVE